MENTLHNTLHNISVPELNDSSYGTNLSEQFNHINDNFAKLSNYDFYKGKDGESTQRIDIDLNKVSISVNGIGTYTIEYDNNYKDDPIEQQILTKLCYSTIANMNYTTRRQTLEIGKI